MSDSANKTRDLRWRLNTRNSAYHAALPPNPPTVSNTGKRAEPPANRRPSRWRLATRQQFDKWAGESPARANMLEYRRRLPHFQPGDAYLFVTWRLWGSLPANRQKATYPTPGHAFVATDHTLDRRGSGPLWLKDARIAVLIR